MTVEMATLNLKFFLKFGEGKWVIIGHEYVEFGNCVIIKNV